jgi:hypothetical protein
MPRSEEAEGGSSRFTGAGIHADVVRARGGREVSTGAGAAPAPVASSTVGLDASTTAPTAATGRALAAAAGLLAAATAAGLRPRATK